MPGLLLSSKVQSFSPQFCINEQNCNLILLPLKLENNNHTNILLLYGSQVVVFDPKDLTVMEEIVLESQIQYFRFEQNELTLKLKNSDNPTAEISDNSSKLTTITSKDCTWTLSSSVFTLTFSSSQLMCQAAIDTDFAHHFDFPILEIVENDHVACLNADNQLQILSKADRKIISAVHIPTPLPSIKSLIWIANTIFVFSIDSGLRVSKFNLMQFTAPTNVRRFMR